jgi:hypothetical protein
VIVIRLEGGLGHQLFQYAAGRRLALARGVPLLIDRSAVDGDSRPYALGPFDIHAQEAPPGARAGFEAHTFTQRLIRRMRGRRLAQERSPRFDPAILDLPGRAYLHGHWQSEQYFSDMADTIRGDLRWKTAPGSWSSDLLARIESGNAVSVHVRRGDRVSDPSVARIHGTCPAAYYRRAWRVMRERVQDPLFVVFADDPAWARGQLTFLDPVKFVSDPGHRPDRDDLWLMTRCRHHVIANSAFSWWGAWLSDAADKVVVAPGRWFADPAYDGRDVVPPAWARVAVDPAAT